MLETREAGLSLLLRTMSVERLHAQDVPSIEGSFFCFAEVNVRVHGLLGTGVARVVESHGMSNLVRRHVREVECVGRATTTSSPIPVIAVVMTAPSMVLSVYFAR